MTTRQSPFEPRLGSLVPLTLPLVGEGWATGGREGARSQRRRVSVWRILAQPLFAALLGVAAMQTAHADLWAYVDSRGVTHFAAEQIDSNYALFFRGDQFDSTRDASTESGDSTNEAAATNATSSSARQLAFFDISAGYKRVRSHIRGAAQSQGVEYELLKAVIATESGFDSQAVSPRGAVGLMQLMPATAKRFGVNPDARRSLTQKLEDPATNLSAGARYLRYLLDLFPGRMDLAVAAYNAGEGAVQRAGNKIPAFRETQNYVKSVMGLYAMLKPPEPVRVHREHRAGGQSSGNNNLVTGRVRMELPAGNAPDLSSTSNKINSLSLNAATDSTESAARALSDLSANE